MASRCSCTCLVSAFLVVLAIPISFMVGMERKKWGSSAYEYYSQGWMRECSKWDESGRRFLVSMLEGGVAEVVVPRDHLPGVALQEKTVVADADVAGNGSLGILIDRRRERVLVAVADWRGNTYSALAAYHIETWDRIFLTRLSGPGEKTLADDVAMDGDGNAYVTDAKGGKIWKVGVDGELLSVITSPLFRPRTEWYYNLIALNGIVYHPHGFLLAIHTSTGQLFRVDVGSQAVAKVEVERGSSLLRADGLELLSPTRLAVAATFSCSLVESLDGWVTATVIGRFVGPAHRFASSATVKDGKVFVSHIFGGGVPRKKHVIAEAIFSPLI